MNTRENDQSYDHHDRPRRQWRDVSSFRDAHRREAWRGRLCGLVRRSADVPAGLARRHGLDAPSASCWRSDDGATAAIPLATQALTATMIARPLMIAACGGVGLAGSLRTRPAAIMAAYALTRSSTPRSCRSPRRGPARAQEFMAAPMAGAGVGLRGLIAGTLGQASLDVMPARDLIWPWSRRSHRRRGLRLGAAAATTVGHRRQGIVGAASCASRSRWRARRCEPRAGEPRGLLRLLRADWKAAGTMAERSACCGGRRGGGDCAVCGLGRLTLARRFLALAPPAAVRWGAMAFDPPVLLLVPLQCLHALSFGATFLGTLGLMTRSPARAWRHRAGLSRGRARLVMAAAWPLGPALCALGWPHLRRDGAGGCGRRVAGPTRAVARIGYCRSDTSPPARDP